MRPSEIHTEFAMFILTDMKPILTFSAKSATLKSSTWCNARVTLNVTRSFDGVGGKLGDIAYIRYTVQPLHTEDLYFPK